MNLNPKLLLNCVANKKMNVKDKKKVSFDPIVKIQNMHQWTFAYREARKGYWMSVADRYRFQLRIKKMEDMLMKVGFLF